MAPTGTREQAEQQVDPDISRHPRHLPLRHAKVSCFPYDVGAKRGAGDVADDRDQIEDHVQPDRPVDAGNDEQPLKQLLHRFDALANRLRVGSKPRKGRSCVSGWPSIGPPAVCSRSVSV